MPGEVRRNLNMANMAKKRRKNLVQEILARLGGRWLANGGSGRVAVLAYHSVHPTTPFATLPAVFDQQLDWLRENCDVIRFEDAWQAAREPLNRPRVAITFDDGYADNYEYAYPALTQRSMPAAFFVTAGLLERDPAVTDWFARMWGASPAQVRPLDWRQVREMRSAGMTIGAHTYSHPNLARLGWREALRELLSGRDILEQRLGTPVRTMSYPFGVWKKSLTRQTIDLAAEAGFEYAGTVWFQGVRGHDCKLAIPRFDVWNDTTEVLWQKVRGWWDYLGWWQQNRPMWKDPGSA